MFLSFATCDDVRVGWTGGGSGGGGGVINRERKYIKTDQCCDHDEVELHVLGCRLTF